MAGMLTLEDSFILSTDNGSFLPASKHLRKIVPAGNEG